MSLPIYFNKEILVEKYKAWMLSPTAPKIKVLPVGQRHKNEEDPEAREKKEEQKANLAIVNQKRLVERLEQEAENAELGTENLERLEKETENLKNMVEKLNESIAIAAEKKAEDMDKKCLEAVRSMSDPDMEEQVTNKAIEVRELEDEALSEIQPDKLKEMVKLTRNLGSH